MLLGEFKELSEWKYLVHSRTYGEDINSLQIDLHSKCNSNKNKAWGETLGKQILKFYKIPKSKESYKLLNNFT